MSNKKNKSKNFLNFHVWSGDNLSGIWIQVAVSEVGLGVYLQFLWPCKPAELVLWGRAFSVPLEITSQGKSFVSCGFHALVRKQAEDT